MAEVGVVLGHHRAGRGCHLRQPMNTEYLKQIPHLSDEELASAITTAQFLQDKATETLTALKGERRRRKLFHTPRLPNLGDAGM